MFQAVFTCFSPYLGIGQGGGGGGSQGIVTQPAHAAFHLGQLESRSFPGLIFLIP